MKKIIAIMILVILSNNCSNQKQELKTDNRFIVSSKKGINLRQLPEVNSKIILLIPANEIVIVIKETSNHDSIDGLKSPWYYINYKTFEGWVFGGYLTKINNNVSISNSIIITSSGIGPLKIGDSFNIFVEYLQPDNVVINEDGTWTLFKNKLPIIKLCDKNYGKKQIVVWAEIYSEMFKLTGNIHVGSTINEFLSQFPCKEVVLDEVSGACFFEIISFSHYNKAFGFIDVYVKSNDSKHIITDDSRDYIINGRTPKFHRNGKIDFVLIHK